MVSSSVAVQRFELNEDIEKSMAEVWRFLTEPYFASQWMKDVEGVIKIGDQPISKGSKLKSCRNFIGRRIWTNFEVTEFEENELYEVFSDDRDVRARYTYSLSEKEEGVTHLQLVVEYAIHGFASFFSSVFDKLIEEHESDHLSLLKAKIEPAVEPDFTPKVVQLVELMSDAPTPPSLEGAAEKNEAEKSQSAPEESDSSVSATAAGEKPSGEAALAEAAAEAIVADAAVADESQPKVADEQEPATKRVPRAIDESEVMIEQTLEVKEQEDQAASSEKTAKVEPTAPDKS